MAINLNENELAVYNACVKGIDKDFWTGDYRYNCNKENGLYD